MIDLSLVADSFYSQVRREKAVHPFLNEIILISDFGLQTSIFLTIARFPCGTRNDLLPLLPSGSDGVRNISLRRTRLSQTWRRERDSNPRYTFWEYTRFPVVHLRPGSVISPENKRQFHGAFHILYQIFFLLTIRDLRFT
jgi:hypothetical protein